MISLGLDGTLDRYWSYRSDDNEDLPIAPFSLYPLAIPVVHLGVIVLRLKSVVLTQHLRDVFATVAGQTVYDARLPSVLLLDVLRNVFQALLLLLRANFVVEVLAVEGESELSTIAHV